MKTGIATIVGIMGLTGLKRIGSKALTEEIVPKKFTRYDFNIYLWAEPEQNPMSRARFDNYLDEIANELKSAILKVNPIPEAKVRTYLSINQTFNEDGEYLIVDEVDNTFVEGSYADVIMDISILDFRETSNQYEDTEDGITKYFKDNNVAFDGMFYVNLLNEICSNNEIPITFELDDDNIRLDHSSKITGSELSLPDLKRPVVDRLRKI